MSWIAGFQFIKMQGPQIPSKSVRMGVIDRPGVNGVAFRQGPLKAGEITLRTTEKIADLAHRPRRRRRRLPVAAGLHVYYHRRYWPHDIQRDDPRRLRRARSARPDVGACGNQSFSAWSLGRQAHRLRCQRLKTIFTGCGSGIAGATAGSSPKTSRLSNARRPSPRPSARQRFNTTTARANGKTATL